MEEIVVKKPVSSLKKVSQERIDKVIELHDSGHSQNYIAKELSMTCRTAQAILESTGRKRTRSEQSYYHHKTSTLREDAFDVITDESAYWLGFLYADGYITNPEKRSTIGIILKGEDEAHLVKFMEFLKAPQEIRKSSTTIQGKVYPNVSIKIGSQRLHQKLMEWGFTHTKSHDAKPPETLKYNRHFWRGMIDGDGYIGIIKTKEKYRANGRKRLHICGTQEMVQGFSEFLKVSGIIHNRATSYNSKGLPIFEVGDTTAIKALHLLYKDSTVYLDRKYQKYLDCISLNN